MTDWRKSAYLNAENWPEAIPPMGPKREYGPYPWGQKVHRDPQNLDRYPGSHPNAASVGGYYMGDVCPYCGVPLSHDEEVVLLDGSKGVYFDVEDDIGDPEVAYHPECWEERDATVTRCENHGLEEFL